VQLSYELPYALRSHEQAEEWARKVLHGALQLLFGCMLAAGELLHAAAAGAASAC
jgi:cytochrome b561